MKSSLRWLTIKEIEPHAHQDYIVPESVEWHKAYYLEHGEFIEPLILEIGGPRCLRKNITALLIDGNHRFHAAKALGLEKVLVKHLDLDANV